MKHIDKLLDVNTLETMERHLQKDLDGVLLSAEIAHRELTISCYKKDILTVLRLLRDDRKYMFKMLVDISGVDYPEREARFDVVYHLLSLKLNARIRVKVTTRDGSSVPSCHEIYSSANWCERETYDMFGIPFEGHPDLRRILTDYNFDGYPLRKDFPVEGKVEAYYNTEEKRVAYKKVDMPQEYRHFDNVSPWEAVTGNSSLSDDNTFDGDEFKDK